MNAGRDDLWSNRLRDILPDDHPALIDGKTVADMQRWTMGRRDGQGRIVVVGALEEQINNLYC